MTSESTEQPNTAPSLAEPMSAEERFVIDVEMAHVYVKDLETGEIHEFPNTPNGNGLFRASQLRAEMIKRVELGWTRPMDDHWPVANVSLSNTPSHFLAETLPTFAREQRLDVLTTRVARLERDALAALKDAARALGDAVELRERIEAARKVG